MARSLSQAMEQLHSSSIEGRASPVRFIQDQLLALHTSLAGQADSLCAAIASSSSSSVTEAEAEYYLGMECVKLSYEKIDFRERLKGEYSVKFGKDNISRRAGRGVVGIRALREGGFYGAVSAIAAAIEGGNCVVLKLDGKSTLDKELSEILTQTMDPDTVFVSKEKISDSMVDFLVDQSAANSGTLTIVDRSADLKVAAKAVTEARMCRKGASVYSPGTVLINEYALDAFVQECLAIAEGTEEKGENKAALQRDEKTGGIFHVSKTGLLKILELKERFKLSKTPQGEAKKSRPSQITSNSQYLTVIPFRSLTHVVAEKTTPFQATYLFGIPGSCKFLAEQVPSRASYVNHIPSQLLVGPATPESEAHSLHPRYTSDMFSVPRPQFVTPPAALPKAEELKKSAVKALPPTGQPLGKALGFFEQGIMIGLGTTALVVLPILGYLSYLGIRKGWLYLR